MTDSADARLRDGYRTIRLVTGDRESPWPGALVCTPSGQTLLAVDSARLGDTWGGWDAGHDGHVLAPSDVLRRPDGHDALVPVCVERLEEFMARRSGTAGDLSAGEAVTIVVSLVRGLAELRSAGDAGGGVGDSRGTWWLSDSGRPVFAIGSGAADATDAAPQAIGVLRAIAADLPAFDDTVARAIEVISDARRRAHALTRIEEDVFALAEPLPLATNTFGPKRARDRAVSQADDIEIAEPTRVPWPFSLSRHLDAEWADLVSRTTTGVWRAARTPRPSRRRPLLVAAGVAGVVLVGGVLWPSGDDGPATTVDDPIVVEETSTPSPSTAAATSTPAPIDSAEAPDLATTVGDLLTRRTVCGDEPECLVAVQEMPDADLPPGAAGLPADQRRVTLVDEFGGAAVLRVDALSPETPAQLVVVVMKDDQWLIRDVYDVADQ